MALSLSAGILASFARGSGLKGLAIWAVFPTFPVNAPPSPSPAPPSPSPAPSSPSPAPPSPSPPVHKTAKIEPCDPVCPHPFKNLQFCVHPHQTRRPAGSPTHTRPAAPQAPPTHTRPANPAPPPSKAPPQPPKHRNQTKTRAEQCSTRATPRNPDEITWCRDEFRRSLPRAPRPK